MKLCVGVDNGDWSRVLQEGTEAGVEYYKVNPWFIEWREVSWIIDRIHCETDAKIILDAKLSDVSHTVEVALRRCVDLKVDAVTVSPLCALAPLLEYREQVLPLLWDEPTEPLIFRVPSERIEEMAVHHNFGLVVGINSPRLKIVTQLDVPLILVPGWGAQHGGLPVPESDRVVVSASRQWWELIQRYKTCHANRDGDCTWADCPQLRDGEPQKSGRHCPVDSIEEGQ